MPRRGIRWNKRRGRDLNPRDEEPRLRDFQSRSFDRSDTSPGRRCYRTVAGPPAWCGAASLPRGGVAERSNAAVSKTVSGFRLRRGFKSPPLRHERGVRTPACPRQGGVSRSWGIRSARRSQVARGLLLGAPSLRWLVRAGHRVPPREWSARSARIPGCAPGCRPCGPTTDSGGARSCRRPGCLRARPSRRPSRARHR